ncbi:hypothetical protein ACVW2L_003158 [Mucilaginibacter sp. HD30]
MHIYFIPVFISAIRVVVVFCVLVDSKLLTAIPFLFRFFLT